MKKKQTQEFIGRVNELSLLRGSYAQKRSQFIVCTGRRRIGKSALIERFAEDVPNFFEFQGLHPKEAPTSEMQLRHFSTKLGLYFKRPTTVFRSWTEAFHELGLLLPRKATLLFLDEVSWMSSGAHTFSAELKDAWDTLFKKHPHLLLVIAGSVSSWIEENILRGIHFLGRVSLHLHLEELPISLLKRFWGSRADLISNHEFFKAIAIFGGVPRYLEALDINRDVETNVRDLCFSKSGFLLNEFDSIFSDIFQRRSGPYRKIVQALIDAPKSLTELAHQLRIERSGSLSEYLQDLVLSGFLSRDITYDYSGKATKQTKFRVKDNYLRFALKYIEPNKQRILNNSFQFHSVEQLPGWKSIVGLQFENLMLNNRWLIVERLGINPADVISCSPYLQKKTSKNRGGCQIDLLIVTRTFQLFLCEIKFVVKLGSVVVSEMKNKIAVLKRPKHFSVHPVLVCLGDVPVTVTKHNLFRLLPAEELLESSVVM